MSKKESFYTKCLEEPIFVFNFLSAVKGESTDMAERGAYVDGLLSGAALIVGNLPDDALGRLMDDFDAMGLDATSEFILKSWEFHRERAERPAGAEAPRREADELLVSAGKEGE